MKELELFFNDLRTRRENPEITIKNYNGHIQEFFKILKIKTTEDLSKITTVDIDRYKMNLIENGNKLSSVRTKLASIRSFFEFLAQRDIIKKNVITKQMTPKVMKSYKNVPTQEDFRKMLNSIDFNSKTGMKYYTMINLFISTGMRFSELVNLEVDSLKEDTLKIKGKGSKERIIILQDNMIELLKKYINVHRIQEPIITEEEFNLRAKTELRYRKFQTYENYLNKRAQYKNLIFQSNTGIQMSTPNVDSYLKKLATKVGIDIQQKDVSAHVLRHFYAIFNLENGVPLDVLQENMGHSNINTTRIYAETSLQRRREESKKACWAF